jgi:hypothetical protein
LTKEIDDKAVPIDQGTLDSILKRVNGINTIWSEQESSLTYLDFPENFPVREMHGNLLGHLVWDEASEWLFQPVTHEAQEADSVERHKKINATREPVPF